MNNFRKRHPFLICFYLIGIIFMLYFTQHPLLIVVANLVIVALFSMYNSIQKLLNELMYCSAVAILFVIGYLYTVHNGVTPILFINGLPLTVEAIVRALAISGIITLMIFSSFVVVKWMYASEWFYLLSRISSKLALFVVILWRFIPLVKTNYKRLISVQQSLMPKQGKTEKWLLKIKCGVKVVVDGTFNMFHQAEMTRTKGYRSGRRTYFHLYYWKALDTWLLCWLAILLFCFVGCHDSFYYYPNTKNVEITPQIIVATLFLMTPLVVEWKGLIKWKQLN